MARFLLCVFRVSGLFTIALALAPEDLPRPAREIVAARLPLPLVFGFASLRPIVNNPRARNAGSVHVVTVVFMDAAGGCLA